jgi:hypothetical protein
MTLKLAQAVFASAIKIQGVSLISFSVLVTPQSANDFEAQEKIGTTIHTMQRSSWLGECVGFAGACGAGRDPGANIITQCLHEIPRVRACAVQVAIRGDHDTRLASAALGAR